MLKPDAKSWSVKEQIVRDLFTGLTLQFEVTPHGESVLRIFGESLPSGNREIQFDSNGIDAGSGTITNGLCRPAWMTKID